MGSFIIQYWLTFLFGLIATGMTTLAGCLFKLYKKEKKAERTKFGKDILDQAKQIAEDKVLELKDKMIKEENKLVDTDNEVILILNQLRKGMLSMQGRQFKEECRYYLEQDIEISTQTYERLSEEHSTYNGLGGNHDGDDLFELVREKYKKSL